MPVGLRRVQHRVRDALPVAQREHRRPGPERRRYQQQAPAPELVGLVQARPFQPVVPPPQLLVQRAEQRLVAARGEHGHAPGEIAVERVEHARPARRDDRVVQVAQRAHHDLQRRPVAVGQVPQPGRGRPGRSRHTPVSSERRYDRGVPRTKLRASSRSGARESTKSGHGPHGPNRSSSGRAVGGNARRASRSHGRARIRLRSVPARRSSTRASAVSTSGAGIAVNRVRARSSAVKLIRTTRASRRRRLPPVAAAAGRAGPRPPLPVAGPVAAAAGRGPVAPAGHRPPAGRVPALRPHPN